ncbi:MAG: deoxyribodipyrimidine photo-lyase, partial [Anaerolineae bacterium]|nr:deoxyribodipyrimidine photo-lyase [Anaerolineae bacterium]
MTLVIHWFRRDLRLSDNTALNAALATGAPVIPLFIFDPALLKGERFSAARLKLMLTGLEALDADLKRRGSGLVIRYADPR